MNRPLAVLGVAICSAVAALGQPSAKALRFEVASVKPSPETVSGGGWVRVGASGDAGRVSYTRVTLNNLLMTAYKVKRYQISGPDWMDRERYDVAAKLPEGSSKDQAPLMLQALLAERFQVALHREQKDLPAYALAPAKGGFKLKPVENPSATMNLEAGSAGRRLQGTFSLSRLADLLTNFLGQPVFDQTGIAGEFEIKLEWTPDEREQGMSAIRFPNLAGGPAGGVESKPSETFGGPSIFAALQQSLGLRLEPRKAPMDILVIDHAEKVPTEN